MRSGPVYALLVATALAAILSAGGARAETAGAPAEVAPSAVAPSLALPASPPLSSPDAPRPAPQAFPVWPRGCEQLATLAERAACLDYVARDFARLDRYAAANAALAPPAAGERRVVLLGDSIFDRWSDPASGGFFPGRPYVNRGIGGQTTSQMLLRFRQDVIALGPAVVVILAGTNDIAGNGGPISLEATLGNLQSMAELARANGIGVVLGSLLPVCDCVPLDGSAMIDRTRDRPPQQIETVNRALAHLASTRAYGFVDYHAALADSSGMLRRELTDDGLHPNAAGYAVMAPLTEQAVARVPAKPR